MRKKELKRISVITDAGESIEEKGNMDVEITIDAIHHIKKYDTAILFTGGDGYFDVLEIKEDIWGRELRHRAQGV